MTSYINIVHSNRQNKHFGTSESTFLKYQIKHFETLKLVYQMVCHNILNRLFMAFQNVRTKTENVC